MAIIERQIQHIRPGKWADLEALDKKFNAVESRYGFPAKKRYQAVIGGHTYGTLIVERQWPSMAAMETAYDKMMTDPEWQALYAESDAIIESNQIELYSPLP